MSKPLTMAKAWEMVEAVQARHPGWRFLLLGGDVSMGYRIDKGGSIRRTKNGELVVAEESRFAFGWRAEFFGDVDPRKADGSRHVSVHAESAEEAIRLACEEAP